MNLLDARLLYDIKHLNNFSEDSFLEVYHIDEEIGKYRYPLDIFPQNAFNEMPLVYTYTETYNYLKTNCTWLWRNFYTTDEIDVIVVYLISIGAMAFDGYNYNPEIVAAFERLVNTTSDKIEIQFCIDEFKYKLLMHYITRNIHPELVTQYFTDLDAIEETHNHILLFGEKLPEYRPEAALVGVVSGS